MRLKEGKLSSVYEEADLQGKTITMTKPLDPPVEGPSGQMITGPVERKLGQITAAGLYRSELSCRTR